MNFKVEATEFVQVIRNGREHWLAISTIDISPLDVQVNDSMHPSVGTLVKAHAVALLETESPAIRLQFMNVQMQAGGYDCGLFAVAFATALAFGEPPVQYHFDLEKIHRHLWTALREERCRYFRTAS